MKKISLIVCSLMLAVVSVASYAEEKVGVLDINKVLTNAPQVKSMRDSMQKQFEPRGQEITRMRDNLKKDVDNYNQTLATLSADKKKAMQQNILQENKLLQDKQLGFQRDVIAAQNSLMQPILQKINAIATDIAHKQNFNLIVTKTSTVYNDANIEITDQVLTEIQKG